MQTDDREHATAIRRMFARVAPRYQVMNHLMSGGLDWHWRRVAVREAALPVGGHLLDLATGTGDLAFTALKQDASLTVVGADFTPAMMRTGRQHPQGERVHWCGADALRLPFPDRSFDAVASAFLIRNLLPEDVLESFREQVRVVRPGGRVVCLDAVPPGDTPLRFVLLIYLRWVIPHLGMVVTGQRDAYTYLPHSVQAFKRPAELAAVMESAGLVEVRCRVFAFGMIALLVGIRPLVS